MGWQDLQDSRVLKALDFSALAAHRRRPTRQGRAGMLFGERLSANSFLSSGNRFCLVVLYTIQGK